MPYRKNGNHQERIPWISAHPYDVKRGTFLGEMSRLATLSSKLDHYLAAMRGLVTLYIRRGYPVDEVHKWLSSNLSKRWENRLVVNHTATQASDVLVLKTQYNLAWNYFNAHELGDVIFGYWREWLRRSDTGEFNSEFPAPNNKDLKKSMDLRETNIFNSKVILSRKRTRNFLDISNLWKRTVLTGIEGQALDDILHRFVRTNTTLKRPFVPDVNALVVGPRKKNRREGPTSSDEEDDHLPLHRRFPSPTPASTSWASAPMGTWGRGSLR